MQIIFLAGNLLSVSKSKTCFVVFTGAQEPPSYNSSLQKLSTPASRTQYTRHLNGNAHSPDEPPEFNGSGHLTVEQQSVSSEFTNDSGLPTDRHSNSSSPTFDHPGELQTIQIQYSTGLGLCIIGGTNRPEGPHIFIDDIIEGGDAHKVQLNGRLFTLSV